MNEYLFEWKWEDQWERARPASGKRAPYERSQPEARYQYGGDEYKHVMVEVE